MVRTKRLASACPQWRSLTKRLRTIRSTSPKVSLDRRLQTASARNSIESLNPPIPVRADGSIAAGPQASSRATLALRQTLLTFDQRKRGAIDALNYGLSLGVTTHQDQGAFQASNTPSDGAAHEDNYSMNLPF